MKLFEKIKSNKEREIRFLGLSIAQYGKKEENGAKITYFDLFPKSFEHKIFDKILSILDKNNDYVIFTRAQGIGETYLLSLFVDEIIKKNKVKNICIITNRLILIDVWKMFQPQIPIHFISNISQKELNIILRKQKNKYKNKILYFHQMMIKDAVNLLENYRNNINVEPYPDTLRKYAKCTNYRVIKPVFSKDDMEAINSLNLKLNKFVFFNIEANYIKKLPDTFWENLTAKFREINYDIFINTKDGVSNYGISANLSIPQAVYLASKSKLIVSMRSGFVELLSQFDMPKHILYTPEIYKNTSAKKLMNPYSLKHYPGVNSNTIYEYDMDNEKFQNVIENILSTLEAK